jgi:hypothetical protein
MIDLNEMSSRVLASLEEAGSERANPLLNTVIDPTGHTEEVAFFQLALLELLTQKRITVRMTSMLHGDQPLSDEEAKAEIERLSAHYIFNSARGVWSDLRYANPPYYQLPEPDIVLTRAGRTKSVELLQQRGYEWWRVNR